MRRSPLLLLGPCLALLALVLFGCADASRAASLRQAMEQARSVLTDPRLARLASHGQGTPESKLVEAFYSPDGRALWPPRPPQESAYGPAHDGFAPPRIHYTREADIPWSVVIRPDAVHGRLALLGYGQTVDRPLLEAYLTTPALPPEPPPLPIPLPRRSPRRARRVTEGPLWVRVLVWETGRDDCIWRALSGAGWSTREIVGLRLVQRVAHWNAVADADLVYPGQRLRVPRRPMQ